MFSTIGAVVDPTSITNSSDVTARAGRRFLSAVDRVLYPITVGYTVVILAFVGYEFSQGGEFKPRFPFADVYLALLTAYAAQREGTKWLGADESTMRIRRGELFVGIWFAVYLFMIVMANLSEKWILPTELKTITLGVLGIFAATGLSSGVRERVSRKKATGAGDTLDRGTQMLTLLRDRGPMSAEEMGASLSISAPTAWRTLEVLEKEGRVKQDQSADSRNRKYRIP